MKYKIAIVRGKFLNQYDMQSYEPLASFYDMTAFGSLTAFHSNFSFPTVKLFCPLDIPEFPKKAGILNRMYTDAQYLYGLERALNGFAIAHTAETYYRYTKQCLYAKKKGYVKKVIVTVWENIPFNNEGIFGRREIKQKTFQGADHFIAVSERAKIALLLEGADAKKITIVHPGINIDMFKPAQKNISKALSNNANIHILFVGRLVENKGIYELLYAIKHLLAEKQLKKYHITLTIIGNGQKKQNMQAIGKKLGISNNVIYGEVSYSDIPSIYQNADIFVAPSKADTYWQEQWGMALMEAQAAGLPIVTTENGSIPENVADAALLVQPADVLSLANAIKRFILHPELRLSYAKKAREIAIKNHDRIITAKKIKEVYEKVLESV